MADEYRLLGGYRAWSNSSPVALTEVLHMQARKHASVRRAWPGHSTECVSPRALVLLLDTARHGYLASMTSSAAADTSSAADTRSAARLRDINHMCTRQVAKLVDTARSRVTIRYPSSIHISWPVSAAWCGMARDGIERKDAERDCEDAHVLQDGPTGC